MRRFQPGGFDRPLYSAEFLAHVHVAGDVQSNFYDADNYQDHNCPIQRFFQIHLFRHWCKNSMKLFLTEEQRASYRALSISLFMPSIKTCVSNVRARARQESL